MEEEKKPDEKTEEPEKEPEESSSEDTDEGSEPKTTTLVDDTNLAAKRLQEATKAAKEERLAREESYAKMKLGGKSAAGIPPEKPKEMTDTEYAEALQRGEVNPLKEDGFI